MQKPFFTVIDNFLPNDEYKHIQESVMGRGSLWYYLDGIDYNTEEEKRDLRKFQFTYTFYEYSTWACKEPVIMPLLRKIDPVALIKAKANLQVRSEKMYTNNFHTDEQLFLNKEHVTSVYYLNTCDGKTVFEEGGSVDSVGNRIVFFPASYRHSGTSVTNAKIRCVININFIQSPMVKWVDTG